MARLCGAGIDLGHLGMAEKKFPAWVSDYIGHWRETLCLNEWDTYTVLSATPNDNAGVMACVDLRPDYLGASIQIRDDVSKEPTADWEKAIIHELLHIRMARITSFVEEELFIELPQSAQMFARRQFRREVEPFVEIMATVLHKLERGGK